MSGQYHFTIEQGATHVLPLTWKDNGNNPFDLTGYSAELSVQDSDGNELLSLTSPSGGIVLGGAAGTITVTFSALQTAAFKFNTARYVLQLINGTVQTHLLRGTISLNRGDA